MNRALRNIIKFILSYVTVTGVAYVSGYGITHIDIILPASMAVLYCIINMVDHRLILKDKSYGIKTMFGLGILSRRDSERCLKVLLPVSMIFSASVIIGRHFDVWGQKITRLEDADIVYWLALTVVSLFAFYVIYAKSITWHIGDNETTEDEPVRTFVIRTALIILCWMPYYLTLFPGNLGKDTFESIDMCLGNIPWTNHHPIFFTALIDAVIKLTSPLNDLTISMGIFTFLHMCVVACTLSYVAGWLIKKGRSGKIAGMVAAVFFAMHPFMAMYSMYITKDVLFACALTVLTLKLIDMGREPSVSDRAVFTLMLFGVMLLRNNGLMIAVVLGVILLIFKRMGIKNVLLTVAAPVLIFLVYRTVAYNALGIEPESFAESAAIPLQQVGYVIDTHTDRELDDILSDEDDELLYGIMPYDRVRRVYELGYVDPYKFDEAFDDEYFNEHSIEFLKAWAHILPGNFGDYVAAYLAQTAGYWHYGETNTVATQGVWDDNTIGVSNIDVIQNVTGVSLYGVIEKLMLGMRKAPILCILSSMAMEFYAVLLLISYLCLDMFLARKDADGEERKTNDERSGRAGCITAYIPLVLLWVSIMIATPAFCLFRYMFPFFILWPVTLYFTLCRKSGPKV